MESLTRSSSARGRNDAARGSVVLALLGLAVPVLAYAAARQLHDVTIIQATAATCGAAVFGGAAVLLARRGLRNVERTLGRVGGEGAARVGRLLGAISLCIGLSAVIALAVYAVLNVIG
jgi:peptidoglycan/LPS O-acetylase OafA/YrhL